MSTTVSIIKSRAQALRKSGLSYAEIARSLGRIIPKSTLSTWLKSLKIPEDAMDRLKRRNEIALAKARVIALQAKLTKREADSRQIQKDNAGLSRLIKKKQVAKIALVMLFLAEGSKRKSGSVVFCNSDPFIISLFLHLLRACYRLETGKFRCTVQCRADQDIKKLEVFWSKITRIPITQFCKAQVDKRSIGKPTKKIDYKGVCRIDCYSAKTFRELSEIPKIIYKGP